MSLVVIYEGQRKVVKIPSPNTLVQALLLDCATQFNVDVAKVAFRHKRTILDNAQPIRFCNLSNNAQVDLIAVSGSGSAKNQSCKIALAIDGGENTTETFDASISLYEMLSLLATQSKIPADIHQRSPEVVYLRAKYEGFEALAATTFTSLGLAGQSARLQLRFSAGSSAPFPISVPIVPVAEPISATKEDTAMEVVVAEEMSSSPVPATHVAASPAKPVSPVVPRELTKNTASALPAPHTTPAPTTSGNDPVAVVVSPTLAPPTLSTLPSPAATVSAILSDNFDRVSIPAVLTLARYLLNILLNPLEDKFRRISTENKAFQGKIATAKGAVNFLCSVGFVYPPYNNAVLVLLPADSPVASSESSENSCVLGAAQLALLQEGYAQLLRAMKELEVPVEERPYQGADWATIQKQQEAQRRESEQRSASQVAAFDPYKTHIVRTAPQPVRQKEVLKQSDSTSSTETPVAPTAAVVVLSSTERQLLELNKKRAELEGNRSDVVRATEVLLPRVEVSDNTYNSKESSDYANNNNNNNNDQTMDSKNVPRSVLSKILRAGEDGDSTPLTTQAVRDLQRAQKERVFNRTLIKIKFPDRVSLQGYFHPRDTVQDVYEWVASCLSIDGSSDNNNGIGQKQWCFELYTSPPRTVLSPFSSNANSSSKGSKSDQKNSNDAPTLASMGFVPAAVIYLAWKNTNLKASPAVTNSSSGKEVQVGGYFLSALLEAAVSEERGASIPTGVSLVPPSALESKSSSAKLSSGVSGVKAGADASNNSADVKKSTKPKWFSLK
eukprot:gene11527-13397_t